MSDSLAATLPLTRWEGERGTYHLVTFTSAQAEELAARAMMERLETGRARGFGSLKVTARIGASEWRTSIFPQKGKAEWILLVSRTVIRAEDLAPGDPAHVILTF
ncbi:DUF1905 domain-containing protein [Erythrobacter sp.]|uniref:DUF1905 domain-containing protein n=1 Tax=Erythrobacter sp. TaxID=1042 RepID=UPI002E986390|nr:DUF1905 domain-containing protein [Erythrobacter sp.]